MLSLGAVSSRRKALVYKMLAQENCSFADQCMMLPAETPALENRKDQLSV
jgi:hypothetical protein